MVVTQNQIDDAIELANESKRALYLKIEAELKKGCEPCKEDLQAYDNLNASIFFLTHTQEGIENHCITVNDIWVQINYVKENSFVC